MEHGPPPGTRIVPKTAFVLPLIPETLGVDPLLLAVLHLVAFLEHSEDETVHPDDAVEAMEYAATYLERLSPAKKTEVQWQLDLIADHGQCEGWPAQIVSSVRACLRDLVLEDGL